MTQSSDIVCDLGDWLTQILKDAPSRQRMPEMPETDLVRRAIAEINGLREKLNLRYGSSSIAAEDLNASNDA